MMTGKIDHENRLAVRGNRAVITGVSKVDDQAETPKGYGPEKPVRPDL